jgi:hypothetical protein
MWGPAGRSAGACCWNEQDLATTYGIPSLGALLDSPFQVYKAAQAEFMLTCNTCTCQEVLRSGDMNRLDSRLDVPEARKSHAL